MANVKSFFSRHLNRIAAIRRISTFLLAEKIVEEARVMDSVRRADARLRAEYPVVAVESGISRTAFARNRADVNKAIHRSRHRLAMTR